MAKVNFNNIDEVEQSNSSSSNNPGNDVGFFTLKNDGDEAIVRFMCKSTDDFEILTVHDIQIGSRYRKVNCIRDPREPLDNCPLCKSGAKINNRFFIKMLQYEKVVDTTTQQTIMVPKAMVWERSTQYAKTLKSYLDNYGPLDDIICKIIRHGKAGDMQTTYEIVPNLSKTVFPDNIYVKDENLFGDFSAFGTIVMDRSYEEMNHFLINGEFPARPKQDASAQPATAAPQSAPSQNYAPQNSGYVPPQYNSTSAPQYNPPVTPAYTNMPGQDTQSQPQQYAAPAPQAAPQFTPPPTGGYNQFGGAAAPSGMERPRRY